jgi:hypothetical protein
VKTLNTSLSAATRIIGWILFLGLAPAVFAADELPKTTPDGMQLVKQTKSRIVYAMPGATLDSYTKVALVDCYVAFKKDWDKDYNRSTPIDRRVRPDDMERIKKDMAAEFRKVLTEELTKAGHEVVDQTGPDVVIIRPAIINLDVMAPDVRGPGMSHVIVRSAGSMTLYMELIDSTTSATFAKVIDAEADRETFAQQANRVTNRAAADRILRSWAKELANHLGAAKEDTSTDDD